MASVPQHHTRNNALIDTWSFVHLLSGVLLGWVLSPIAAIAILVLWEPLEVLVISPICARFGIVFGYETVRNSLSDIVFDLLGVAFSMFVLIKVIEPPFILF